MVTVVNSLSTTTTGILANPKIWISIFMFVFIAPISFFRSFSKLTYVSCLSVFSVGYLVMLLILFLALPQLGACDGLDNCVGEIVIVDSPINIFSVLSIFVFSYTCQQNIFSVYNEFSVLKKGVGNKNQNVIANNDNISLGKLNDETIDASKSANDNADVLVDNGNDDDIKNNQKDFSNNDLTIPRVEMKKRNSITSNTVTDNHILVIADVEDDYVGYFYNYSIESINKRTKYVNFSCVLAIVLACFLYLIIGLCGYFIYGNNIENNVLDNLPSGKWYVIVGDICIVTLVMFSYPLQLHPARISVITVIESVIKAWHKHRNKEKSTISISSNTYKIGDEKYDVNKKRFDKESLLHIIVTVVLICLSFLIGLF
eukprot:Pgem_evm1s1169